MTDQDVVTRVAELFDRAVVPTRARRSHHKRAFVTTIKGAAAARIMRALAPLMSPRRCRQIDRALRHQTVRTRSHSGRATCVVAACSRRPKAKGLCKQHYHQWWKSIRRGRTPRVTPVDEELVTDGSELGWAAADAESRSAWLAGLLEGEGSFFWATFGGRHYPRIQVTMSDRDVLERAMTLMPGSHMYVVNDSRSAQRGWSQVWMVRLNGAPAADTMKAVRRWMGSRRGADIDRVLLEWHPIRLVDPPAVCVITACARPHRARGLCNTHYMSWSRDLAKGRTPRVTPVVEVDKTWPDTTRHAS